MSQRTMNATDYLATMSEAQFQNQVLRLAETFGWSAYHTHDSRRSQPGFPDLVLTRDGLLIFAELKAQKGRASKQQDEWLAALARVAGFAGNVIVRLWRPQDVNGIAALLKTGWRVPVGEGTTMRD